MCALLVTRVRSEIGHRDVERTAVHEIHPALRRLVDEACRRSEIPRSKDLI